MLLRQSNKSSQTTAALRRRLDSGVHILDLLLGQASDETLPALVLACVQLDPRNAASVGPHAKNGVDLFGRKPSTPARRDADDGANGWPCRPPLPVRGDRGRLRVSVALRGQNAPETILEPFQCSECFGSCAASLQPDPLDVYESGNGRVARESPDGVIGRGSVVGGLAFVRRVDGEPIGHALDSASGHPWAASLEREGCQPLGP